MRDRAYRRTQAIKAKQRAVKVLTRWWGWTGETISARDIGVMANVHGKPCSCWCCGNPRRHFNELTVQERKYANQNRTMAMLETA